MGPSRRIFKGPAEFRFETLEKGGGGVEMKTLLSCCSVDDSVSGAAAV